MEERTRAALPTTTLERARAMRHRPTDAEHRLWHRLRGSQLGGFKFRRQHPIPPYIADFWCGQLRLVIEVDGSQHTEEADRTRTAFLEGKGMSVMRFWSNDVLSDTDAVVEAILNFALGRPLTPNPSPDGRGVQKRPRPTSAA